MRALVAASVFALPGCVDINGGAVEFGWLIRGGSESASREGQSLSCRQAGIAAVRLIDTDPEGEIRMFEFDCDDGHGSTAFILPEGRHLFGIEVEVEAVGPPPEEVAVPNPISAQVRTGEVTDLQILVIRLP